MPKMSKGFFESNKKRCPSMKCGLLNFSETRCHGLGTKNQHRFRCWLVLFAGDVKNELARIPPANVRGNLMPLRCRPALVGRPSPARAVRAKQADPARPLAARWQGRQVKLSPVPLAAGIRHLY